MQKSRLGSVSKRCGSPAKKSNQRSWNRRPPVTQSNFAEKYKDFRHNLYIHFQARAIGFWGPDFRLAAVHRCENLELIMDAAKVSMDEGTYHEFLRDIDEEHSAEQRQEKLRFFSSSASVRNKCWVCALLVTNQKTCEIFCDCINQGLWCAFCTRITLCAQVVQFLCFQIIVELYLYEL